MVKTCRQSTNAVIPKKNGIKNVNKLYKNFGKGKNDGRGVRRQGKNEQFQKYGRGYCNGVHYVLANWLFCYKYVNCFIYF